MLGKGAKRKLNEDDEGVEGKTLAMADGLSKVSYTLQRQTIFNISLMKLYSQRALVEPSLEKRVLINNMLRRIQDELKQEGSLRPLFFPPSPPPDHPMDEGYREAQPAFGVLSLVATPPMLSQQAPISPPSPVLAAPLDACLTPASLLEEDSDVFCTSPSSVQPAPPEVHPTTPANSFSSALEEIEELCPLSTTAGPTTTSYSSLSDPLPVSINPTGLPMVTSGSKNCTKLGEVKPEVPSLPSVERQSSVCTAPKAMETLPPSGLDLNASPSPSSSSGFLTDLALDDILFADIDTSMYDFDPCTSASGTSVAKLSPVVTADELIKTLSPNQPFKMDLTELDHIMEVLVGS